MTVYKPAGMHIVHQNISGEVIVVDLQAGFYFSLTETAPYIWEAIAKEVSHEQIIEEMTQTYDAQPAQIVEGVNALISQLESEQLIVKISDAVDCKPLAVRPVSVKLQYAPPVMHKYSDMEDVLSLDPIHDFDEAGWPNQPAAAHSPEQTI